MTLPLQRLFFTTIGPLPGWAVVNVIGLERAVRERYWHTVNWRRDPGAVIQITLSGCGACRIGPDQPWQEVPPGSAMIFVAGPQARGALEYHVSDLAADWESLWLELSGTTALAMIDGLVETRGHVLPFPVNHPLIRRWIGQMPASGMGQRILGAAESALVVNDFLQVLGIAPVETARDDTLIARAVELLGEHWNNPPAIGELAVRLGVSREHLVRKFHASTGAAPTDWLRQYRIQRVADLLLRDERTIAQVAKEAGFATASHFVQTFRRVMGETPRTYRNRRRYQRGT